MRYVVGLIAGLVVGILLTGCETAVSRQVDCEATGVNLEINDTDGRPLSGVTVRFRVDDGAWQEVPLAADGSIALDSGAGTYLIVVEKPGYRADEISVTVPTPSAADCEAGLEEAVVTLANVTCQTTPQPLTLTLRSPEPTADFQVEVDTPAGGSQSLPCTVDDSGTCRKYSVPLSDAGEYAIKVSGLPADGRFFVVEDVVAYEYTPFDVVLAQGMRREQLTGEGAAEVRVTLPVTLDEVNCPLAELQEMGVTLDPDRATEPEEVSVQFLGNLTMTDPGAAGCEVDPEPLTLTYEVRVPAGTHLSDVTVQARAGEAWETAVCRLEDARYLCVVALPNPLVGQSYAVQAVIDGDAFVNTQLPFDNLCILFDPAVRGGEEE